MVLGPVLAAFATTLMGQVVVTILVAVGILLIAKYTKLDDQSFVEWIVLLLMIAAIGTLISSFAVGAGAFVLNVSNFTISGLAFTVLYVLLAELILHKAVVKI